MPEPVTVTMGTLMVMHTVATCTFAVVGYYAKQPVVYNHTFNQTFVYKTNNSTFNDYRFDNSTVIINVERDSMCNFLLPPNMRGISGTANTENTDAATGLALANFLRITTDMNESVAGVRLNLASISDQIQRDFSDLKTDMRALAGTANTENKDMDIRQDLDNITKITTEVNASVAVVYVQLSYFSQQIANLSTKISESSALTIEANQRAREQVNYELQTEKQKIAVLEQEVKTLRAANQALENQTIVHKVIKEQLLNVTHENVKLKLESKMCSDTNILKDKNIQIANELAGELKKEITSLNAQLLQKDSDIDQLKLDKNNMTKLYDTATHEIQTLITTVNQLTGQNICKTNTTTNESCHFKQCWQVFCSIPLCIIGMILFLWLEFTASKRSERLFERNESRFCTIVGQCNVRGCFKTKQYLSYINFHQRSEEILEQLNDLKISLHKLDTYVNKSSANDIVRWNTEYPGGITAKKSLTSVREWVQDWIGGNNKLRLEVRKFYFIYQLPTLIRLQKRWKRGLAKKKEERMADSAKKEEERMAALIKSRAKITTSIIIVINVLILSIFILGAVCSIEPDSCNVRVWVNRVQHVQQRVPGFANKTFDVFRAAVGWYVKFIH